MDTKQPTPKIIDRIRHLLALASNNPSEAEATSAAAAAARLMREYDLEQAEIEAAGGTPEAEPIVEETIESSGIGRNREVWKSVLQWGIGHMFKIETVRMHDGRVIGFGRLAAVQSAKYTLAYLINEIEAQAQRYWRLLMVPPPEGKRVVLNDFRRAAAGRLQDRMREIRREQDNAARASEGALIVLARKDHEVEAAWKKRTSGMIVRGGKVPPRHTSDAAVAGDAAGAAMRISGGTALNANPLALPARS